METMKWFRQLQWQIVGSHMVVVVVGVVVIVAMTRWLLLAYVPAYVAPTLERLAVGEMTPAVAQAELVANLSTVMLYPVPAAAGGAIIFGLLASVLLARLILLPLQRMDTLSQRIASGRYDERLPIPHSLELANVATQFNQMAAALEQVEQQRVALIGNVSHELRTPLTALQGYIEGLQDGVFQATHENLEVMRTELERLRRLVDDLQMLSRIEAGHVPLQLQSVELMELLKRLYTQLQPQLLAKQQTLELPKPRPVSLLADPDRIAQILLNLLGNSIRYTDEGGRIVLRVEEQTDWVVIEVQDNGIGIPAEALPYLFERFYRVDSSRSRKSGGSGIGLTIARHLAWAMGGDITASSPGRGQGATFTLTLPKAD